MYIDVNDGGAIYGEGGAAGDPGQNLDGGGALYINNTLDVDNVSVVVGNNGKIWAGGGGGYDGNQGNSGNSLSCYTLEAWNTGSVGGFDRAYSASIALTKCKESNSMPSNVTLGNVNVVEANQNSVRSRCRGGTYRRGSGWNSTNFTGYACSPDWTMSCSGRINNNVSGGNAGNGGNGGVGQNEWND